MEVAVETTSDAPKNTRAKRAQIVKDLVIQIQDAAQDIVVVDASNITIASQFLKKSVRPVMDEIESLFSDSYRDQHNIRVLALQSMHNITRTKNILLGPVSDINTRIKGLLSEYALADQLLRDRAEPDIAELSETQLWERLEESVDSLEDGDPAIDELFDMIGEMSEGEAVKDIVPQGDRREKPKMAEGTYLRTDWTWEEKDPSLVKKVYLMLDRKKINHVVKKIKDKTQS